MLHVYSHFRDQKVDFPLSAPRFIHVRDGQTIFSGFAGENGLAATVTGLGDAFQVPIFKTTANWFDVLGVRPIRGRTFLPAEQEGADVAVITESFWKAHLGGDPNVVGRALTLDGVAHTIIGVIPTLPVSWTGPNADIWTTKPFVIPKNYASGFSLGLMAKDLRTADDLARYLDVPAPFSRDLLEIWEQAGDALSAAADSKQAAKF